MGNLLSDRVAVITGSGQGIGKAIAIEMTKAGAKVVVNDIDRGSAGAVATEINEAGGKAIPFFGDISDFEVARELIKTTIDNYGRLDILVNNAGNPGERKLIWEMSEDGWDHTMAAHLKGSFNCIRHACIIMKEQRWGRIINTSSSGRLGKYGNCDYSTAKAGVLGLTRSVALDLGDYGITCNSYAPAAATKMNTKSSEEYKTRLAMDYKSGAITKAYYERQITPRPGPEAMAPFLVYLCTDEAADINGQLFFIWGRQEIQIIREEMKNSIKKEGFWTAEELLEMVPKKLLHGLETSISLSSR